MDGFFCPKHQVPTLQTGPLEGPVSKLEIGTILVGKYRVEGLAGRGGMGAVLHATRLQDQAQVVLKVLRGAKIKQRAHLRRFYLEAQAIQRLDHPHVVRVFEFGVDEATRAPFLAMELVRGQTLDQLLLKEGRLNEQRAGQLGSQVAWALFHAHESGVLHRDLKPRNIMILGAPPYEQVKVLDFGLAKIVAGDDDTPPLTAPGRTVGTPAYMSPEQITQRPQDYRTDLYGLGCVLFHTLCGRPPFGGNSPLEIMRKHLKVPASPLPERLLDGQAPSVELSALMMQLLAKHPHQRPESTEEVAQLLETISDPSKRGDKTFPVSIPHYQDPPQALPFPQEEGLSTDSSPVAPEPPRSSAIAFAHTELGLPEEHAAEDAPTFLENADLGRMVAEALAEQNVLDAPTRQLGADEVAAHLPSPEQDKTAALLAPLPPAPPGAEDLDDDQANTVLGDEEESAQIVSSPYLRYVWAALILVVGGLGIYLMLFA